MAGSARPVAASHAPPAPAGRPAPPWSRVVLRDPVRAGADAGAVLVQRLVDHLAALGGLHDPLVRGGVGQRAGARRDRQLARWSPRSSPRSRSSSAPLAAWGLTRLRFLGRGVARRPPRLGARRPLADHRRRRADLLQRAQGLALAEDGRADAPGGHLPARRRDRLRRPGALLSARSRRRRSTSAPRSCRCCATSSSRRSRPRWRRPGSSPSPGRSTTSRSRSSPAASTRRSRSGSSRSCASPRTCRWSTPSRP